MTSRHADGTVLDLQGYQAFNAYVKAYAATQPKVHYLVSLYPAVVQPYLHIACPPLTRTVLSTRVTIVGRCSCDWHSRCLRQLRRLLLLELVLLCLSPCFGRHGPQRLSSPTSADGGQSYSGIVVVTVLR